MASDEQKKNELMQAQQMAGVPAAPAYLQVEDDHSVDELKHYIRPPRVKVIQSMSSDELKQKFGVADTILVPDNVLIMEAARDGKGNVQPGNTQPFLFTPLFFFTEFCVWNPLEMKDQLPAIRERSTDPNSAIAKRARDWNNKTMPCPENPEHECEFCEHMNFIIHIQNYPEPCVMTFSRGEFKAGVNFATLAKLRKQGTGVPLYANVFAANLTYRQGKKGSWYGLDVSNPDGDTSPYVGEEAFNRYKEMHAQFAKDYADSKIEVNYEDEPIDATSSPSEAANSI